MIAEFCHLCVKYRYESRKEVRTVFGRLVRMERVANPPFLFPCEKGKRGRSFIWSLGFYLAQVAKPAFSTMVTRRGNEDEKMVRSNYDGGSDRSCYIGKLPYRLINCNEETPLVSSGVFS